MQVLSGTEWGELRPLIEDCRPKGKTPPQDLRRTIEAILWRHQNGAKWRAIPAELGPWWRAAQIFMRWAKHGVWERLRRRVQERARHRARHDLPRWYDHPRPRQGGRGRQKGGDGK